MMNKKNGVVAMRVLDELNLCSECKSEQSEHNYSLELDVYSAMSSDMR